MELTILNVWWSRIFHDDAVYKMLNSNLINVNMYECVEKISIHTHFHLFFDECVFASNSTHLLRCLILLFKAKWRCYRFFFLSRQFWVNHIWFKFIYLTLFALSISSKSRTPCAKIVIFLSFIFWSLKCVCVWLFVVMRNNDHIMVMKISIYI